MPKLPTHAYDWYVGIDPGFTGGIAIMDQTGEQVGVSAMPTTDPGKDRQREMDLTGLQALMEWIKAHRETVVVGLEWPTTRPGEGAERSERFGRGKGYLEAFLFLHDLRYYKLAPNLWKGRLGLPGKDQPGAITQSVKVFETYYPAYAKLIRGPRDGVLTGPLDALLIAHFLRTHVTAGMRSVVEQFGKDSPEVQAMIFSRSRPSGRRRRDWDTNFR